MNEEEKKAIKKIEQLVEYLKKWNENFTVTPEDVKYFEKVLEVVKTYMRMTNEGIEDCLEYEEELQKKDKEILHWKKGMQIIEKDKNNHIEKLEKELDKKNKIINLTAEELIDGIYEFKTKKQVIDYFTKKAEE